MPKKNAIPLLIALVFLVPVSVFSIARWIEKKWQPLPVYNVPQGAIGPFYLTNQQGKTVSLQDWKGKIVVADFFFTHCPVICPRMTAGLKKVSEAFPDKNDLLICSFSVDPLRDSVPALRAYAERFAIGKNWHLLTGNKARIYQLARGSFAITSTEGDGGAEDFIHSEKLVLIDRQQKVRGYYNGTSAVGVQQLLQDIKKLNDEK